MRAPRWYRYCYFCREFWENRVAATSPRLDPGETKIPDHPDQNEFVSRWHEYHRGYRLNRGSDGSEERIPVLCEKPWKDTDPGFLPVLGPTDQAVTAITAPDREQTQEEQISVEETIDELLEQVSREPEDGLTSTQEQISATVQPRSEDTRPAHGGPSEADFATAQQCLDRLDNATAQLTEMEAKRDEAAQTLRALEAEVGSLQDEQGQRSRQYRASQDLLRMLSHRQTINERAAQRMARIWGTREEMEQQGSEYVSPLTTMFTRAYERYSVAEEVRAEERASTRQQDYRDLRSRQEGGQYGAFAASIHSVPIRERLQSDEPQRTLDDEGDKRPPPMSDEQMTVKLACKICLQQMADTAVLPCGHLVMCSYCAEIWAPSRPGDSNHLSRRVACPLCRKSVKRKATIYTS